MIKTQAIIAVADVEKSSLWYQELLSCKGLHGGDKFEMLADTQNEMFLFLHKWGEDNHPTMSNPLANNGHGLILYIQVQDFERTWKRALALHAEVEAEPQLSPNSGKLEFSIRDLDGYYLIIAEHN